MRPNSNYTARDGFSLARAIVDLANPLLNDFSAVLPDEVLKATRATEHGFNEPHGPGQRIVVPIALAMRDLNLGAATAGGNLVASPKTAALDALRGHSVVVDAGVSVLELPIGSPPGIPFVSSDPVATWATGEGVAVGESEPAFGLASFAAHTVGLHFTMSRRLLAGLTPANERQVMATAARALGRAIDAAVLQGTNSNGQPQGLATLAGVTVTSGTSLTHAAVQAMVGDCLAAGVREDAITVVGAVNTYELLSSRERASGSGHIWQDGRVAGRPAFATAAAPASSLFVGDFSQVRLAIHGGLTVIVDRMTYATSGSVRVVFLVDLDVLHPRPAAFSRALSIT